MAERKFEVVVWGATGFTGRLVAEYLAKTYGTDGVALRWALAGRNEAKLKKIRAELAEHVPGAESLDLIVADSFDRDSLQAMAASTTVVCTTVGPYLRYGKLLAEVCAEEGTHYCDLTGETPFVKWSRDTLDETAQKTGAKIVHCCGYDSIPSDLGSYMVQQEAIARWGAPCERIEMFVGPTRGGASGGTIDSMVALMELAAQDRQILRIMANPYALTPKGGPRGPDGSDQTGVKHHKLLNQWTGPFVMAAVNTRIVRLTNALLDYRYGEQFRYSEVIATGRGRKGLFRSLTMAVGMGAMIPVMAIGPTRRLLQRYVLPKPGEGPGREQRENGFFRVLHVGERAGERLVGRVVGQNDPGYGETSRMIGEAAVCLAKGEAEQQGSGGVGTPAAVMGDALLERLRAIGMTFSVEAWPEDGRVKP